MGAGAGAWDDGWEYDRATRQLRSRGDKSQCLDTMGRKGGSTIQLSVCSGAPVLESQVWVFTRKKT